ncbi:MAG: colanic acid biosynthesis glycosyltransferase WcaL [Nitrospirales bacterium]|nr:MAG: colanic acid biosynthesis glycosyltransferase WcaL [Nitrospirales bacterium]
MKIALVVDKFPNRSQTFVMSQITGLIDRDHEVHIHANAKGKPPDVHSDIEKYSQGARAFYLWRSGLWSLGSIGMRVGTLLLLGVRNVVKSGKVATSLKLFLKGAGLISNGPYDIVHCHFGPRGNIGAALKAAGVIQGKLVTTFYGFDLTSYIEERGPAVYNLLFSRGDLFIAISEKMKNDLIRLGCRPDKIIVHRLGVDLKNFQFRPSIQKKVGERIQILTIGRFVEKKGMEYGLRAFAKVVEKFPQIEYKIVGDGELRDEIDSLVSTLNLDDRLQLLGWKTQEDVAKLLESADIFLAPSVTSANGDQEGTPTVIIEALARGVPVLSTDHAGIPELIQNGKSGFLVPERDVEALSERLEWLINHPEVWEQMGCEGRKQVEKYYDINKLNDQLVNAYECLIGESRIL